MTAGTAVLGRLAAGHAAGLFLAALVLGFVSSDVHAQTPKVTVESAEFLVSVGDGQGSARTIAADVVPFLPNRACFGWRLKLTDAPAVIRYREVLQLPRAPAFWSGENDEYSPHRFSADRTTAITEAFAPLDDGWIGNDWCIAEGDPLGPHSIEVFIGERLARRFEFEVREP